MTHILARQTLNNQADEALRRVREDDARRAAAGSPGTGPSLAEQAQPLFNDSWQCAVCRNYYSNRQTTRCTVCN